MSGKQFKVCVGCWSYDDDLEKCLTYEETDPECKGAIYDFHEYTEGLEACVIYMRKNKSRNYGRLIALWYEAHMKAGISIPKEKMWLKELGLKQAYIEDTSRGGGSHSEGSNKRRGLDKDNRLIDTIPTAEDTDTYRTALREFEQTFGELERLSKSLVSGSKIDSYTGDEI